MNHSNYKYHFNTEPEIKQMPEYDPDAELSSLNLTGLRHLSEI